MRRPAHRHLHAGRRRPRAGRAHPHRHAGDRHRAGRAPGGHRRRHRARAGSRPSSSSTPAACGRRRCRRWWGRSRRRCRSTTSTSRCLAVPRPRAAARHAVLPRHRQPRLRQAPSPAACCSAGTSRTRWRAGWTGCPGITAAGAAARRGAVRAADGRRRPAVPVPGGRRRGGAGLPPRRDDARRQPAARADPRRARLLAGGRAVAERLRRRGRHGPHHRRVDHHRRDRARHPRLSGVAVRRGLPQPRPGRGRRPRGLPLLLPAALPARHRRVGPAQPPRAAARAAAGPGRGVRVEERLGAARLLPARPAVAPGGCRPARVRLAPAAVLRPPGRGAHRVPRARRHDRHELVRQDRRGGPGRAGAARAGH